MIDSRPARKASKKALEEMARETQRMSRSMQLAHQARTKKSFPVADLLKRFNYRRAAPEATSPPENDEPSPEAQQQSSDHEHRDVETPPTSPVAAPALSLPAKQSPSQAAQKLPFDPLYDESEDELPVLDEAMALSNQNPPVAEGLTSTINSTIPRTSKSPIVSRTPKPKKPSEPNTAASRLTPTSRRSAMKPSAERAYKRIMERTAQANVALSDSDDDLEIVRPRTRLAVFDQVPAAKEAECDSLRVLRTLAHIHSPTKSKPAPSTITASELQASLQRRAKAQAEKERHDRIEALRAKGVIVQTDEEREKSQLELDTLLEKARKEAALLAKQEKDDRQPGDDDLPSSDEDDEFEASAEEDNEEDNEEEELELSGSEDEELDVDDEQIDGVLLDNEAEESDDDNAEDLAILTQTSVKKSDAAQAALDRSPHPSRMRQRRVVLDDDDEEESTIRPDGAVGNAPTEITPHADPTQPSQQEDSLAAAFGFGAGSDSLPGLTQVFAGTMADTSQDDPANDDGGEVQQDSLDFLRAIPSSLPTFDNMMFGSQNHSQTKDSQAQEIQSQLDLGITQLGSQDPTQFQSQANLSDFPNPTPDAGFQFSHSPVGIRQHHSTVSTAPIEDHESPIVKRRGRLQRRERRSESPQNGTPHLNEAASPSPSPKSTARASERAIPSPQSLTQGTPSGSRTQHTVAFSDEEAEDEADFDALSNDESAPRANAFEVLKKRAKKREQNPFDKKRSGARNMVDEQAEESEDEYAGLGGASDDESVGEVDEEVKQMIDESHIEVDEQELAALHANKARADEEKLLQRLYKDINTGGLRRKRDGFDLSDSEDEAAERQRRKQRDFAKMRKALLEDENIQNIASNPKREAFLRTLEDHDDDLGVSTVSDEPINMTFDSQTDSQAMEDSSGDLASQLPTGDEIADTSNSLKRPRPDDDQQENRPPPAQRRTNNPNRKPTTLADIRESVSFLIGEDSQTLVPFSQESDSETEESYGLTRMDTGSSAHSFNDRYTAQRTASSTGTASHTPAFVRGSGEERETAFKPPTLLRRVTARSNSSDSGSGTGVTTRVSNPSGSGDNVVRRGGTKKANIHHQAREAERQAAIEKAIASGTGAVKKRVQKKSGLGALLGGNGFE